MIANQTNQVMMMVITINGSYTPNIVDGNKQRIRIIISVDPTNYDKKYGRQHVSAGNVKMVL